MPPSPVRELIRGPSADRVGSSERASRGRVRARDPSRWRRHPCEKTLALVALGVAALLVPSSAAGETTREIFPVAGTFTACGVDVEFSGEAAAVFVTTETPSGGLLLAGHF